MNDKLHSKLFSMAAATLGLSLAVGCAKKAEEPAGGEAASGADSSCESGSCGAHHEHDHDHEEKETSEGQEIIEPGDAPASATGS